MLAAVFCSLQSRAFRLFVIGLSVKVLLLDANWPELQEAHMTV